MHIEEENKDACIIFETLTRSMKEWKLDFDKCVEFGSDGASTIIGKQNEVIARLKKEGKSFFNLRLLCGT